MYQNRFRRGFALEIPGGAYDASPERVIGSGGGHPLRRPPLRRAESGPRLCRASKGVKAALLLVTPVVVSPIEMSVTGGRRV